MYTFLHSVKVVFFLCFFANKKCPLCVCVFPTTLNLYVILIITFDYKQQ